jgi:dihydroxy-acid dehydratase
MRSDAVKVGMQQAPHRSLFNALGLTEEELSKPLVGIVSSYNEIVPGHMNIDKIVILYFLFITVLVALQSME